MDEIRITPGTDLAVYEKGTWRERSQDKAQRILILGMVCLTISSRTAFAQFWPTNTVTSRIAIQQVGDVAIRVNNDMMKFAHAMIANEQASWLNVAFNFLRIMNSC